MSNETKENLEELIDQFFTQQQAKGVLKDIETSEAILRENAAPAPADELIEEVKFSIAEKLKKQKEHSLGRLIYRATAVAAAIIIGVSLSVMFFAKDAVDKDIAVAMIPAMIWESENLAETDAELATFTAEIEEVESDLVTLQLNETNGNGYNSALELEMEFIEIEGDFWKG